MSIRDQDYLGDVYCWRCSSRGSITWRTDHYYCRVCAAITYTMVPVKDVQGGNVVKIWRETTAQA